MAKCVDCGKHEATVKYCNSVLEISHGWTADICQCCYVQRIENILSNAKSNLAKQKTILKKKGCVRWVELPKCLATKYCGYKSVEGECLRESKCKEMGDA